jgi:hypothetical protein
MGKPTRASIIALLSLCSILSVAQSSGEARAPEVRRGAEERPQAVVRVLPRAAAAPLAPGEGSEAERREQERGGETFPALLELSGIREGDREIIRSALLWFPASCREHLRHLVVRYHPSAERGLSTSNTILLRGGMSKEETVAVLFHECGHIMDLGVLRGTAEAGLSAYPDGSVPTYANDPSTLFYAVSWDTSERRRADAQREDFVSGYAMEDPFEDLAESVVYNALHERAFRQRAKGNSALAQKIAWLERYVFGPHFQAAPSDNWNGEIIWDTTKLPHALAL